MIDADTVRMITEDVLISMLELPAEITGGGYHSGLTDCYRATIEIHQDARWEGVLLCSVPFARRVAAQMFMCSSEDVVESEVADAVGELINIIGGNVKGAIGGDGKLTLPKVSAAYSDSECQNGGVVSPLVDVVALCDGHPMRMLFQMLEPAPELAC